MLRTLSVTSALEVKLVRTRQMVPRLRKDARRRLQVTETILKAKICLRKLKSYSVH